VTQLGEQRISDAVDVLVYKSADLTQQQLNRQIAIQNSTRIPAAKRW